MSAEQAPSRLRDLSPQQWRSGIAAWLGWLFDGLDMHLYTLVAAPFVMELLSASSPADPLVRERSSFIQAAFLTGWALGGGLFGRVGDRLGRSRALSLTILTYAFFTGTAFFATSWWQLLVFRFLAALGIGGEWAVGASLLTETWPKAWRPWIAAFLQAGVNLGILMASLTVYLMADLPPRTVFLVGVLPALLVFWIRKKVPETGEWQRARGEVAQAPPRLGLLFSPELRALTLKAILVCSLGLTAWWAFMFWHPQHLRNLPELQGLPRADRERLVSLAFFLVVAVSIAGNFVAGFVVKRLGYRRTFAAFFLLAFLCFVGAFGVPHAHGSLVYLWLPAIGFASGVFGLFTMYLPPLFPTLLRTTGAGFSYNIGRLAAAAGTVLFGLLAPVGDFRLALLLDGGLFLAAAGVALTLPEPGPDESRPASAANVSPELGSALSLQTLRPSRSACENGQARRRDS